MKPFQIGERVKVYAGPLARGVVCTVKGICKTGELNVAVESPYLDEQFIVWPQQCRHLKPKALRREFEITQDSFPFGFSSLKLLAGAELRPGETIRLREVRK